MVSLGAGKLTALKISQSLVSISVVMCGGSIPLTVYGGQVQFLLGDWGVVPSRNFLGVAGNSH